MKQRDLLNISAIRLLGAQALLGMCLVYVAPSDAQTNSAISTPNMPAQTVAIKIEARPTWAQLTPQQQQALQPLSADWADLDAPRKKKWLQVAQRFPALTLDEQQRLHSRMLTWAKLSPNQRQQARDNYIKTLSGANVHTSEGTQKPNLNEQWAKYQALPPEKKAALQADAELNSTAQTKQTTQKTRPLSPQ